MIYFGAAGCGGGSGGTGDGRGNDGTTGIWRSGNI